MSNKNKNHVYQITISPQKRNFSITRDPSLLSLLPLFLSVSSLLRFWFLFFFFYLSLYINLRETTEVSPTINNHRPTAMHIKAIPSVYPNLQKYTWLLRNSPLVNLHKWSSFSITKIREIFINIWTHDGAHQFLDIK